MTTMRRRSSKRGINRGTQSTSTKRGINRGTQSTSENTSSFDIQKQLSNYKTRLGDASEEATDTRNPIEKALNLKKDQNVLFDIFELLGRPQQALFGAIDAGQKGKDIGKGALKGLTGEKETSGKQLLKNAGMKDRKGKLDVSDVLGFGLDVFADPMDVPLIPVKGVTAAGKVLGKADNVADAARAAGKAADVADAARTATKFISPSEGVLRLAGKGVKGAAKLTDKGVEKILDRIDTRNANKVQQLVNKGMDISEARKAVGKSLDKLQTYKDIKTGAQKIFDSSKNVKGLVGKSREADNIKNMEKYFGAETLNDIKNTATNIAKRGGSDFDKEYANLMSKLSDAVESNADWSLKGSDVIKKFKAGKTADFFTEDQAKNIQKTLDNFGIKTTLGATTDKVDEKALKELMDTGLSKEEALKKLNPQRILTLDSQNDVKKLYSISDAILDEKTGTKFADNVFGRKMSGETFDELEEARKYFEDATDPELKNLYNKAKEAPFRQAQMSGELRGINPENMIREGQVRHNLNKDLPRSQINAFNARKYDAPIREVNKIKQAEIGEQILSTNEGIKKLQSQIYQTDEAGNFVLDSAGNLKRDDNLYKNLVSNKENYINNLQKQIDSYKEIVKKKVGLDVDTTKLTSKGEKALKTIDRVSSMESDLQKISDEIKGINFKNINPENAQAIKNVLDDYNTYTKKVTSLKNYASKKNVDEIGGLLPRKEQVKGIFENIQNSKKRLSASMAEARNLADTTNRDLIKKANKSVNETFEKGKKYAKLDARFRDTNEKVTQIYQNAADMVDSLTKKLNFEKASLDKLKGAGADTIFKQKIDKINKMSEAVNTLTSAEGKEFFKTAFDMNFADYIKRNSDFTAGAQKFNDALISGVFTNNSDFVKTLDDLVDGDSLNKLMKEGFTKEEAIKKLNPKIPYGFEKVSGSYLNKKLKKYENILSDSGKEFIKDVEKYIGEDIYMDKDLVNMLDVGAKVVANEASPLLKVWDGINNTFKKFSTLSPGFQMRNIIGNSTDMVLSGMPAASLPSYYKKAHSILKDYDNLAKKAMDGTLDAAEKTKWSVLVDFNKAGFDDAYAKIQNLDTLKLTNQKNPINKIAQKSMDANEYMDRWNRMTLYLYAKDNPKYLSKLGVKNATDAVKKVLFDPSNMSEFETKFAKRVIPFYTFTKQNLMFQMDNMMRNTPKYNRLFKSLDSLYDNFIDENSYYQYQKEGMQIPLPFSDDKGNQLFLKSNLPLADLGDFMSNPLQRVVSSTTPLIRTPFEMVTGKDTYTGNDSYYNTINDLVQTTTGKPLSPGNKDLAGKAEQILAGLGMSNISTNLVKKVTAALKKSNGNMDDQALWAEIFRSILQNTNQEKVEQSKAYEDLERYQSYIKSLKNQGIEVPTIRELNNQSKRTLRNAKNRRAKRNRY